MIINCIKTIRLSDGIEIVGKNPKANGLEFRYSLMPIMRGLLIRNVHHGIHLASQNRNVIIDHCHIYNCTGVGVYIDSVNLHQIIIGDSHISFCKQGGIKVFNSEIMNFQITGNDIEYNCDPQGPLSADIWVDCSSMGNVCEGTIAGNTIQAIPSYGGANIRFTGSSMNKDKIGLWSVSGNFLSNQTVNIYLEHARGITITGNTFIRGYERNIMIDDCQNMIISSNIFDRNKDYFTEKIISLDGISVMKSNGIIIDNNILDGIESGNQESGGALHISECQKIILTGCQFINPGFRGIMIERSENVRVSGCLVREDEDKKRMLWGVEVKGPCKGCIIEDNSVEKGKKGDILNEVKDACLDGEVTFTK